MRVRVALLLGVMAGLAGCTAIPGLGLDPPEAVVAAPFPECQAHHYAFAGSGTLAGVGLVGQSAAELPEPNRPAMIWVTRDAVPFDAAPPGGSRMLCFKFDDGSGGSEWPVDPTWQPPGGVPAAANLNLATPLLGIVVAMMLIVGALAFRRR